MGTIRHKSGESFPVNVNPEPPLRTRAEWIERGIAHGMTRQQSEEFHKDFPPVGKLEDDPGYQGPA